MKTLSNPTLDRHRNRGLRKAENETLLGQQLIRRGLINQQELEHGLRVQALEGNRLGETLVRLGYLGEEELNPVLERILACPSVRLRDGLIDVHVVQRIPKGVASRYHVLALFQVRDELTVAMSEPTDLEIIDEVEGMTGCRVRPVFAVQDSIDRMIDRVYDEHFVVDSMTADLDESSIRYTVASEHETAEIADLAEASPIVNLVNFMIVKAIDQDVSDIHIEPGRQQTFVRFRIDGHLVDALNPKRAMHTGIVSRIKKMAKLDISEQRFPQDGRCQISIEGKEIDLRISTLPTVMGEKVVIRVLDRSRLTFRLDQLGMSPDILTRTRQLISKPHGLVLVTGPTGSGKSTTLYSALELMKSHRANIVTIEDPVEYQLDRINQVQTDKTRDFDFNQALRAILRQDPDVIMVGEIRDPETAAMAVQAALTGHLVLSTLHTHDCCSAVTRLADMGVERYKIAAALVGVIAQRLVRKICPHCKINYFPGKEQLSAVNYDGKSGRMFARGEGCRDCLDTGYRGRQGIYEVMEVDPLLRDQIVKGKSHDSIRAWFQEKQFLTLVDSGIELAEEGVTSLEEISRTLIFD